MTAPETVTIDGMEYEERESDECGGCAFDLDYSTEPCWKIKDLICDARFRPDRRDVIFVRKEGK